ncbi:MAG: Mpo1-like protein, partial [Opitutales bacterium]
ENNYSAPVGLISLSIFVVAWILQFIGHKIEGKKPSFFQDIIFLMIGPLWTLSFVYKRLGIKI